MWTEIGLIMTEIDQTGLIWTEIDQIGLTDRERPDKCDTDRDRPDRSDIDRNELDIDTHGPDRPDVYRREPDTDRDGPDADRDGPDAVAADSTEERSPKLRESSRRISPSGSGYQRSAAHSELYTNVNDMPDTWHNGDSFEDRLEVFLERLEDINSHPPERTGRDPTANRRQSLLSQLSYVFREMARLDGLYPDITNIGYDASTVPPSAGPSSADPFSSGTTEGAAKTTSVAEASNSDVKTTTGVSSRGVTSASTASIVTQGATSPSASSAHQDATTPCASSTPEVGTLNLASLTQLGASDSSVFPRDTTTAVDVSVQALTSVSEKGLDSADMTSTSVAVSSGSKKAEQGLQKVTGATEVSTAAEVDENTRRHSDDEGTTLQVDIGNDSTAASSYLIGNGTDQSTILQTTTT